MKKWSRDIHEIDEFLRTELHLTLHPDKRYLQHYSKGVEFLGFKLRFGRILPSDRIIANFSWKIKKAICLIEEHPRQAYQEKEHLTQVVNSYCGLMKWCNSYNIRKEILENLKQSRWKQLFDFSEDFHKVNLKPDKTFHSDYIRRNNRRKLWQSRVWNPAYQEMVGAVPSAIYFNFEDVLLKKTIEDSKRSTEKVVEKTKYVKSLDRSTGKTVVRPKKYKKIVRKTLPASDVYTNFDQLDFQKIHSEICTETIF